MLILLADLWAPRYTANKERYKSDDMRFFYSIIKRALKLQRFWGTGGMRRDRVTIVSSCFLWGYQQIFERLHRCF